MKEIDVVAAVIRQDDKVLSARRRSGKNLAGYWEFPGGKVEPGEDPKNALLRELKEELGAAVEVMDFICTEVHEYPEVIVKLHCYWCSCREQISSSTDHDALEWFTHDQLESVNWAPADINPARIVAQALANTNPK
jgi:8-oxo-dGTP diphosphatase